MLHNELLNEFTDNTQRFKYFHILASIYVAGIITSLTVSARLLPFHVPFTDITILLTAGTWTIPLSFFIQNITTEVYGYSKSVHLVKLAVAVVFCYVLYIKATTYFPIPEIQNIDASYNTVFDALPRHLIALLTALLIGNIVNDYILSRLKIRMNGKYLAIRFVLATAVGEVALQVVGTSVAWFGNLKFQTEILPFIAFSYLYKVSFEALMSPVNIFVCNKLKQAEGIDIYDYNVNYSPFQFRSKK